MKSIEALGLRVESNRLYILDQSLLPQRETWVEVHSPDHLAELIRALRVRGAPLLGVSAALALGLHFEKGATRVELEHAGRALASARPTAVNLAAAITRLLSAASPLAIAEEIFDEDVDLCNRIASHGAALIEDGDRILTHCNAGGLATAGIGTALGVVRRATEQGKQVHVYVDETRPLLQGGRLTAWELEKLGIPYTLICDNMAASLMRQGHIDKAVVGADRIARNGDFANKIGTYGVAVLCHFHALPFYVAAPYTTVDENCPNGSGIPVELRAPAEVHGVSGAFGEVRWAPERAETLNPAFDVTPARLVTRFVLDQGCFRPEDLGRCQSPFGPAPRIPKGD